MRRIMAQEFWDEEKSRKQEEQEMNDVINILKMNNIDYTVEGNKIMIIGKIENVHLFSVPGITIAQGRNKISFEKLGDVYTVTVKTQTGVERVRLSPGVIAYYEDPFLVLKFVDLPEK